jgi:hypothetical protein
LIDNLSKQNLNDLIKEENKSVQRKKSTISKPTKKLSKKITFDERWINCCLEGDIENLENLISENPFFNLNTKFAKFNHGTSYHIAISKCKVNVIEYLLKNNADTNIADKNETYPVFH